MVVISVVGLIDDLRTVSPPAKIAGQILAAGLLVLSGVELLFFWFPSQGVISLGSDLAVPLTIVWVLLMVNAVNLIDGLDGLAAGIVVDRRLRVLRLVSSRRPTNFGSPSGGRRALWPPSPAGAAIGFLPYNFHPARIFMGDSGSMLLGLLLAAATIAGVGRTVQASGGDIAAFSIPVLLPLFVLAVPLLDVGLAAICRRCGGRARSSPRTRSTSTTSSRRSGTPTGRTVLLMYFWSVLLAGAAPRRVVHQRPAGRRRPSSPRPCSSSLLSFLPRRIVDGHRRKVATRQSATERSRSRAGGRDQVRLRLVDRPLRALSARRHAWRPTDPGRVISRRPIGPRGL